MNDNGNLGGDGRSDILEFDTDGEATVDLSDLLAATGDADLTANESAPIPTSALGGRQPLYLDIETVPDESRMELFGLEAPSIPNETAPEDCPDPNELLKKGVDAVLEILLHVNPRHDYLCALADIEVAKEKPRDGIRKAIAAVYKMRDDAERQINSQQKQMSLCPEMCQIVAIGWAVGNAHPGSLVVGQAIPNGVVTERGILEFAWSLLHLHGPVVGYNVRSFDLRVIRVRSILLGIEPSCVLNDSPYGNRDVCDLMDSRYGRGGGSEKSLPMKQLARLYGIPVPAGDVGGEDVARIFAEGGIEGLGRYVQSDVWVSRELHRKFYGYFCV